PPFIWACCPGGSWTTRPNQPNNYSVEKQIKAVNLPANYVGFSLEEERRLRNLDALMRDINAVDAELAKLLLERNSLSAILKRLDETTTKELLEKETKEERRLWQDTALLLRLAGRTHDAIA